MPEKRHDEIFCQSCGEPIKKQAEICPECGVRNTSSTSSSSLEHAPSQYETTVSDSWYLGVGLGVILWIGIFALIDVQMGGTAETIMGFVVLAAWVIMPLAVYFDMQYVRANSKWNPNTVLWIIAMLIWVVNIIAGIVYLYRRHESLGRP